MTDSTQDQKANLTPEQKIRDILTAYKRYPYGTKELPHITGDEAVQQLLNLIQEEKIIVKQQMKANVWTNFKLEMAKQDLSARPPKGTRFRTPLEELTIILEQEAPLNDLDRLQALKQPKGDK